jgi:hypothetical protein
MFIYNRSRLFAYGTYFICIFISVCLSAWSRDWALAFLVSGMVVVFLITHYLCAAGQANRFDFGTLICLYIIFMFLGATVLVNPTAGIEELCIVVLIIFIVEYHRPNWIWELRHDVFLKE